MRVFYNDLDRELPEGTTVADLIRELKLEPKYVAVEVNFELVPRQMHDQHTLYNGDRLEIVTLVGGG